MKLYIRPIGDGLTPEDDYPVLLGNRPPVPPLASRFTLPGIIASIWDVAIPIPTFMIAIASSIIGGVGP